MLKSKVEELNSANSTLKRSTEESALAEAEEISRFENELNDAIIYSDKIWRSLKIAKTNCHYTKLLLEQATEEMKKLDTELSKAKSETSLFSTPYKSRRLSFRYSNRKRSHTEETAPSGNG